MAVTPLDSLIDWFGSQGPTPFPVVLTELLRWGVLHHEATEAAFRDSKFDGPRTRLRGALDENFPRTPASHLEPADLLKLAHWLKGIDVEHGALAVRLIAKQFDTEGWLERYLERRESKARLVGPNELVPRLSAFRVLKAVYGHALGTNPASQTSRAELSCFALLPERLPHGLRVRLHAGWDPLDKIDGDTSLQTLVPWCWSELTLLDEGEHRCFGVAPREAAKANRPIELAERAVQGSVVVLPEVAVSDEQAREVGRVLSARKVLLGVCGSAHVVGADGVRANVSRIVSRQGLEATQRKIVRASLHGRTEDIETADPTLEVFFGSTWSAVVLICRDFIDQRILELVRILRPGLVLVPACSPSTPDFENDAASLASAQAHVLVANTCEWSGPDTEDPAVSIVSRPSNAPLGERVHIQRRSSVIPPQEFTQKLRPYR